jgi:hypothetical protein
MRASALLSLLLVTCPLRGDNLALVGVGEAWRYRTGTNEPSSPSNAWRQLDFDDAAWLVGRSGFGHVGSGYLAEATLLPGPPTNYLTVYFRTTFTVADPSSVQWLTLRLNYDAGVVAYLNGSEVARGGFAPGTVVAFDTPSPVAGPTNALEFDLTAFLPLLNAGTNLLALELHNTSLADPSMILVPELRANFTRGPYLQSTSSNRTLVVWKTPVPADSRVDFGIAGVLDRSVQDTNEVLTHVVELADLVPDTAYAYRLASAAGGKIARGSVETFRTLKAAGPVRFMALGDSGGGSVAQYEIARVLREAAPDLVLHTGDAVYPVFDTGHVDARCLSVYGDQMRAAPFFFTIGNHDLYATDAPYLESFYLPTNAATGTEHFYSFDHGDVHFSSLFLTWRNQNYLYPDYVLGDGTPQYQWLTNDLASTAKPWKVLFFHAALNTSGEHRWDSSGGIYDRLEFQRLLLPLAERYGVQLILTGHDHSYQSFAPMSGTHIVVTGGGGGPLYPDIFEWDPAAVRFAPVYHCVRVEVGGDTLRLDALDPSGTVFDSLVIQRALPPSRIWPVAEHTPQVETSPANNGDGNLSGQTFDFVGEPIPTLPGRSANLGEVFVNRDHECLYVGFSKMMIRPDQNVFLFLESPRLAGVTDLIGLGNGRVDPDGEGADGLDFLENLTFTNFTPALACILGDEFGDQPRRSFARSNLALNIGQGVFRLDATFSDVPGARLQQFDSSPQVGAVPYEANANFLKVAIPLSALGNPQPSEMLKLGAVVAGPGVHTNVDQQTRELDRAFLGDALYGSGQGPVVLEGLRVQLPEDPDPDGDGLTTEEELRLGTDPRRADTDGDGLLDGWEVRYGLNPLSAVGDDGADGDPDGDGFSNLAEQANGTNPHDPASALRLTATLPETRRCGLSWAAVLGRRYVIEFADTVPAAFQNLAPEVFPRLATSNVESYEDLLPEPAPAVRFYRLKLEP